MNKNYIKLQLVIKYSLCLLFIVFSILVFSQNTIASDIYQEKTNYIMIPDKEEYFSKTKSSIKLGDKNKVNVDYKIIPNLNYSRFNAHMVKLKDGKILILGGYQEDRTNKQPKKVKYAEIYNPQTEQFTKISDMLHVEIYGTYMLSDGKILILSKDQDCQIFNPITETFSTIYKGIKELPNDEIYIIEEDKTNILIVAKSLNKIIRLNPYNGDYNVIYNDSINQCFSSIPLNKKEVLCVEKISKEVAEKQKNDIYHNVIDNKDIYLFNIQTKKYKKIGVFNEPMAYFDLILLEKNKILLYFSKPWGDNNKFNDLIIDVKNNRIEIKQTVNKVERTFGSRKAYKLSNDLIYFSTGEIFDYKTDSVYKYKSLKYFVEAYFTTFWATTYGIIEIKPNVLLKIEGTSGWHKLNSTNAGIVEINYEGEK